MIVILSAFGSLLSFRFRSRASLELELVALRHELIVLRRQRPRRLWLLSADRLLWVWLYHQASDRDQMAPQRLSDLLAVAITLSRAPQD
jgi:hypothetical protein